jgi:hypothetical protein
VILNRDTIPIVMPLAISLVFLSSAMPFVPPVTMIDFFRQSEGIWFTQRTVHHFDRVADESGESKLHVKLLSPDDPRIEPICQQQGVSLAQVKGSASFMWQPHEDTQPPNPAQAAVLVDVPDDESGRSGKLLRNQGYVEKMPVVCRYWFGQDGILTIDTEYENNQGQERCWFINDQFRVRVSTIRMMNGVYLMTYCSERRWITDQEIAQMAQAHD